MESNRILFICDFYPNRYKPYEGVFFRYHAYTLSKVGKVKVQTLIRMNRFGYEKWKDGEVDVECFIMPYKVGMGYIFLPLAVLLQFILTIKNLLFFKPTKVILQMSIPHGLSLLWFFKGFYVVEHSDRIWKGYKKVLAGLVLRFAKRVGAVSTWQADMIYDVFGIKPYILGNPLPHFEIKNTGENNNDMRIIFIGTIAPNKNPMDVLKVASLFPQVKFIFVGRNFNDGYYKDFKRIISGTPNATYLGPMDHGKVLYEISRASFLVSTSKNETFGYTIAEALYLGKPVVWYDSGGPRDFLNEYNSVKVRRRDPLSLSCAILECIAKIRKGYFDSKRISREISDRYSEEVILQRYKEFLNLKRIYL